MHPRCRCTIAATLGEGVSRRGKRAARDSAGKRIKISGDLDYSQWKAVYIDKNAKPIRGLGTGNKISFSVENVPPHIIEKIPNLTPTLITSTLEKFELHTEKIFFTIRRKT